MSDGDLVIPPCEVCEKPAICVVRDCIRLVPRIGDIHHRYKPAEKVYFFCEEHQRENMTIEGYEYE